MIYSALVSTGFWATSTDKVSWPQGYQFRGGGLWHTGPGPSSPMTDELPRGATSTIKVECPSYIHSEPPRRKGLKISGRLISCHTVVELVPPQRPRLPIEAMWCSARRPSLSVIIFPHAVASAAANASGSACAARFPIAAATFASANATPTEAASARAAAASDAVANAATTVAGAAATRVPVAAIAAAPAVASAASAAATATAAAATAAEATSTAAGSRFVVTSGPRCQLRLSCCGSSCVHPRWKP